MRAPEPASALLANLSDYFGHFFHVILGFGENEGRVGVGLCFG
jgi:hypothetical protein